MNRRVDNMNGRYRKQKGSSGEMEILAMLANVVTMAYREKGLPPPELHRGSHGRDIRGLSFIAPEIKRHERDNDYNINAWWTQAKEQSDAQREPVLFYRMNYQPWNVRMFGYLLVGNDRVRCPVDITLAAFMVWFKLKVEESLAGIKV
jgi:hypothetical protein